MAASATTVSRSALSGVARPTLGQSFRPALAIAFRLLPTASPSALTHDRRLLSTSRPVHTPRPPRITNAAFSAANAPPSPSPSGSSGSDSDPKPGDPPPRKGPLRDEEIAAKASQVRLVDPKTGSLAGPFPILEIISKLDRNRFRIEQLVAGTPRSDAPEPSEARTVAQMTEYPICKLIDKKEDFDRQRALKRKAKANEASNPSAAGQKEVQLTWSVAGNDLTHKLSKARKELLKGAKINVVITTKSGGKKYIRGKDAKEDERKDGLMHSVEEFLCAGEEVDQAPSPATSAAKAAEVDDTDRIEAAAAPPPKGPPVGRRSGKVDWQRGGSAVVLTFERIDRGK